MRNLFSFAAVAAVALSSLAPSALTACSSDGGGAQDVAIDTVDDTATTDAAADVVVGDTAAADATMDATAEADAETAKTIRLDLTLVEVTSNTPVVGATVSVGDASGVTASDGTVGLDVPADTDVMVTVTGEGLRDQLIHFRTASAAEQRTFELVTDGIIVAFEVVLGGTFDPAKGNAEIRVVDAAGQPISDMTVTPDRAFEVAITLSESSSSGVGLGTTTKEGPLAIVLFANMEPGALTPTFSHPSGYTCVGPSPLDVPAGSIVTAEYRCALE